MGFIDDLKYTRQIVLQKNWPVLLFLLIVLLAGVTAGTIASKTLDLNVRQDLSEHLQSFLLGLTEEINSRDQKGFFSLLIQQLKILLLIWLLGLSIVGFPFIPIVLFLRGFLVGFTIGFLIEELAFRGFVFALASLLGQNLISLPLYAFMSLISLAFAWNLLNALLNRRAIDFWQQFIGYSLLMALCGIGFLLASLVEYYLSPILMELATSLVFKGLEG